MPSLTNLGRLRNFVSDFADLLASSPAEPVILDRGAALLADLVRHDDWLPDAYALADPARYRQYLLHCDSRQRFSVVSFVWASRQSTPIHDHTVWGLIGVLRGAELGETFEHRPGVGLVATGQKILRAGTVAAVSPSIGDIHRVSDAAQGEASVSIHVYGANIGAVERATYDVAGTPKRFVSGYADLKPPNLWGRSGVS